MIFARIGDHELDANSLPGAVLAANAGVRGIPEPRWAHATEQAAA